jgi:anti-sigma regulatory factor (Ser/Thr protein kinase)
MVVRRLQWKAAAVPEQVRSLRRMVATAAVEMGLDPGRIDHLQLALSEALSNIVLHAYGAAGGEMRVDLERDEDELRVVICDDGPGLGARPVTPGLGLGLGIVATASDRCEIATQPETGTRLTLVYDLG